VKKFNWKNRKFISGLLTLVLLGFGVSETGVLTPVLTELACDQVQCDGV
jgi:hypothetical protein